MSGLAWHRSDFGLYADSPTEALRYYVEREGTTWTLAVHRTETVAGVTVVRKGLPVATDQFHPTARLAKAVAAAYDTEPDRAEGKATNRMTRAVGRAYAAPTQGGA